jgi:hypothetical protein
VDAQHPVDHQWRLSKGDGKFVYVCDSCGARVEAAKGEDPDVVSRRFVTLQTCRPPPA